MDTIELDMSRPFSDTDTPPAFGGIDNTNWGDVSRETSAPAVADVSRETSDPDAPYGRKPDGTPYKMSAEARAAAAERMRAGRARAAGRKGKAPKSVAAKATPNVATPTNTMSRIGPRTVAASDLLELGVGVLAVIGLAKPAFKADALTIEMHRGAIAVGVAEAAEKQPAVARFLDKAANVGPYATLVNAVTRMGMQLATNHGLLKPNPRLGTVDPVALVEAFAEQMGAAGE